MSRDIPIIFSAPMVLALLAGRKTMTRRLAWRTRWNDGGHIPDGGGGQMDYVEPHEERVGPTAWQKVTAGDRLWVRESLTYSGEHHNWYYAADRRGIGPMMIPSLLPKGVPSIHMPRWASRLTLEVTSVKIERLQIISEADAIAEGIEPEDREGYPRAWKSYEHYPDGTRHPHSIAANKSPATSFRELWQWLHGHETWTANPEVVAMSFKVHQANIDALREAA